MNKKIVIGLALLICSSAFAQKDSSLFNRVMPDSGRMKLNMDAVHNRPFLQIGELPATLGGYVEANTAYFSEDGITEGLSIQVQGLTLFEASTIRDRLK